MVDVKAGQGAVLGAPAYNWGDHIVHHFLISTTCNLNHWKISKRYVSALFDIYFIQCAKKVRTQSLHTYVVTLFSMPQKSKK